MQKILVLGDEAIAQGAIDGGMSGIYAYPGTPSTEITEYVQKNDYAKQKNIRRKSIGVYHAGCICNRGRDDQVRQALGTLDQEPCCGSPGKNVS